MKFALPKNRTAPLIIFAIFGMIALLSMGLYHMNRMVQYSYMSQYEDYSLFTENASVLIRQEMEYTWKSLEASTYCLAGVAKLDKATITKSLASINSNKEYIDMAVVDLNGQGYNMDGQALDLSEEDYFTAAVEGKASISNYPGLTRDNSPVILFSVPILKDDNTCIGVLTAQKSAELGYSEAFASRIEGGCAIYLVNQENTLMGYVKGADIRKFNYEDMMSKSGIYENIVFDMINANLKFIYEGKRTERPERFIWCQAHLGINGWSVVAGGRYNLNGSAGDILQLTNLIWIAITVGVLFMFIVIIINRQVSNNKVIRTLYLDPVTGGDNWYKFRLNMNKILGSKQYQRKNYALINFDINRFKIINDAYGYQKGDEVLKDIYYVIKKWIGPGEPFTRYAADQFYVLMAFSDEDELVARIMDLNDRIHQLKYTKMVRIFYGVFYITERKDSIDRMGEFAQIAKNNIKGSSESIISFFDDSDRDRLLEEEEIEKSMNEALKNNEFQVYLQPKYMAKEEIISGAEALVRWHSNNGMPVSPCNFIPLFEKNGFITELDYYMLKKVCQLLRSWLDKGYVPLPISVNISRLHFANAHLAEIIAELVDSYEIPRNLIELELTESAFLQNKQMLINTVIRLREYGFLVSMDDFGAGYSSLNSLKDLPLDTVKLDGELFRLTDEVERGLCVIRNTITMAKDLHMKVVAECIETREQVEFLCKVGCDIIQGYYFARPMPADQFEARYLRYNEID